jgi:hypothetical protein
VDFEHNGVRYQIQHAPGSHRLRVWYQRPDGDEWQSGHGKEIPPGMSVKVAAEVMRRYIVGEIDWRQYNATLPGK